MRERAPAVYLLCSQRNGTLYVGVTSNLVQRVWQHREGLAYGFPHNHASLRWCGSSHTKKSIQPSGASSS